MGSKVIVMLLLNGVLFLLLTLRVRRLRGYNTFPCSTQLSMEFILFIILRCQQLAV